MDLDIACAMHIQDEELFGVATYAVLLRPCYAGDNFRKSYLTVDKVVIEGFHGEPRVTIVNSYEEMWKVEEQEWRDYTGENNLEFTGSCIDDM